jgi:hypothetical protein
MVEEYKHPVARVAAFETEKGIGNRCGDAASERRDRRLLILMTPLSEPKGSAREGCETFSSHSNKNEWHPEARTRRREQSGSTKVELRCRSVTGGGGKATKPKT